MMVKSKWFWVIGLSILAVLLLLKVFDYYNDNQRYAHYIWQQWSAASQSDVEDGYTDKASYDWGEVSRVFVNAKESKESFLILYNINGIKVDSVFTAIFSQDPQQNSSVSGYGYSATFNYEIPRLRGGVYLWEKKIPFLIKGNLGKIGVLYPTNTLNAYNISGGQSLYSIFSRQADAVSFLRPMFPYVSFQSYFGLRYFFNHDKHNFTYLADIDLENPNALNELDLLIIAGHSEYWTRQARLNFDEFVDAGGHTIILSGNTMWWQVRYSEDKNTMVCYKSLEDTVSNPLLKTINWSESSLQYPISNSIVLDFQHGGFGRKNNIGYKGYKVVEPDNVVFQSITMGSSPTLAIPSKEYDGLDLDFSTRSPTILDHSGFNKIDLLGYDSLGNGLNGAFVMARKTDSSGIMFNVGTMDWCSAYGLGGEDSTLLQSITDRMIEICLNDSSASH